MARHRLFNILAGISFAMLLICIIAWLVAWHRHLPEADRIWNEKEAADAAVYKARWDSPLAYRAQLRDQRAAVYDVWNNFLIHRVEIRQAERWKYVVLPRRIVLALAVLPAGWFVITWWKLRRQPPPASVGLRIVRSGPRIAFTSFACICAMLLLAVGGIWVRSYTYGELFYYGYLNDTERLAALKQHELIVSRGKINYYDMRQPGEWWSLYSDVRESLRPVTPNLWIPTVGYRIKFIPPATLKPLPGWSKHVLGVSWTIFQLQGPKISINTPPKRSGVQVQAPVWLIELILLPAPLIALWRRSRRVRLKPGHCAACGYDLTGNTSGVCPECGKEMSHAEAQRSQR